MTNTTNIVNDSSNITNFKAWAQAISSWFATAGWVQGTDSGQVNWSTISTIPAAGTYVYEIWTPGDALTVFYVKMEYGTVTSGGANCPSMRLSIATATNGAGTLTGYIMGPNGTNKLNYTAVGATTPYECDFAGGNNWIAVMMWRNAPAGNNCQQFFAIERSLNATGAYTGSYVTLFTGGYNNGQANFSQQSLVFAIGAASVGFGGGNAGYYSGFCVRTPLIGTTTNSTFNNSIPFDTPAPCIGFFDLPVTVVGTAYSYDIAEAVTFLATLYGTAHTYLPSKIGVFSYCWPQPMAASPASWGALCMRFE